jgi:hypothetical protein
MRYPFKCYDCETDQTIDTRPLHPPKAPDCPACGEAMDRVYGCSINTSSCQDVDFIPEKDRIACGAGDQNMTSGQAAAIEKKHAAHNEQTRRDLADGGNRGQMKKKMQIPAALYHGKIKQTGDRNYWDDSKNRNRHKSCQVS